MAHTTAVCLNLFNFDYCQKLLFFFFQNQITFLQLQPASPAKAPWLDLSKQAKLSKRCPLASEEFPYHQHC